MVWTLAWLHTSISASLPAVASYHRGSTAFPLLSHLVSGCILMCVLKCFLRMAYLFIEAENRQYCFCKTPKYAEASLKLLAASQSTRLSVRTPQGTNKALGSVAVTWHLLACPSCPSKTILKSSSLFKIGVDKCNNWLLCHKESHKVLFNPAVFFFQWHDSDHCWQMLCEANVLAIYGEKPLVFLHCLHSWWGICPSNGFNQLCMNSFLGLKIIIEQADGMLQTGYKLWSLECESNI